MTRTEIAAITAIVTPWSTTVALPGGGTQSAWIGGEVERWTVRSKRSAATMTITCPLGAAVEIEQRGWTITATA